MTNENKEFSQSYFEKKSLVEKNLLLPKDFSLEENEDFLKLKYKGEEIGTYSTNGVTSEKLREDVEETIEKHQKGELVAPDIKI